MQLIRKYFHWHGCNVLIPLRADGSSHVSEHIHWLLSREAVLNSNCLGKFHIQLSFHLGTHLNLLEKPGMILVRGTQGKGHPGQGAPRANILTSSKAVFSWRQSCSSSSCSVWMKANQSLPSDRFAAQFQAGNECSKFIYSDKYFRCWWLSEVFHVAIALLFKKKWSKQI